MIQVDVHRRENLTVMVVLDIGELGFEVARMMVIEQRNDPDDFFVFLPLLLDEGVAHQVSEGFRAIGIAARDGELVEFFQ